MATANNTAPAQPATEAPAQPVEPTNPFDTPLQPVEPQGPEAVAPDKAEAADNLKEKAANSDGGSDHWYDFLPADWSNWISDNTQLATVLFIVALLAIFVLVARAWNGRNNTVGYSEGYSGTEGHPEGFTNGLNENPYTDTAVSEGTDGLSPADEVTPQTTLP